ncbi:S8 family serine peptidase [Lysobacter korlensis]|uniref:S8 family serine peptidase n=1 Tax=Lysobacter korlensis TaxID=553636 RepID=A0ABV6RW37_9GAMM
MEKYIVLKDLERGAVGDPFGNASFGPGVRAISGPPEPRIEVLQLDHHDRAELLRDQTVVALAPAMPTRLIEPVAVAPAADAPATWGVAAVGADTSPFTGQGTVVAVLDTGIDATHPAFQGVDIVQRDFTGEGDGDGNGHGTHCAGTVFGRDVDGQRIGVAPGVPKALIAKVLGAEGGGDSEMLLSAIQWALDNGANVISMSLGFDFPGLVDESVQAGWPPALATSRALELFRGNLRLFDAVMSLARAREAFGGGAVVVAAAGNESQRNVNPNFEIATSLPAAADGVVSVGALGRSGDRLDIAPFSNTFPMIAAPGVGILSAEAGGGLRAMSGTSMATPHVAGLSALWWEQIRASGLPLQLIVQTVVAKLRATARVDTLVDGLDAADRGAGLAVAPDGSS